MLFLINLSIRESYPPKFVEKNSACRFQERGNWLTIKTIVVCKHFHSRPKKSSSGYPIATDLWMIYNLKTFVWETIVWMKIIEQFSRKMGLNIEESHCCLKMSPIVIHWVSHSRNVTQDILKVNEFLRVKNCWSRPLEKISSRLFV